jgi:putative hydrolase of the HAD superfamily
MEAKKKYLWFDLGYTLLRLKRDEPFIRILESLGITLSPEKIEKAFHVTDKKFMREYPGVLAKDMSFSMPLYLGNMMYYLGCETDLCALHQLWRKELENPLEVWEPFDFVEKELERLSREGYRLGVISNWDSSARPILERYGLIRFFDNIVISSEVGSQKPDSEIFRQAFREAGVEPEECLYIGDNYYDDGVGCRKVGMDYLIINPYGNLGVEELAEKKDCRLIPDITHIRAYL